MKSALKWLLLALVVSLPVSSLLAFRGPIQSRTKRTAAGATSQAAAPVAATVAGRDRKQSDTTTLTPSPGKPGPVHPGPPVSVQARRAASRRFDVRNLPPIPPHRRELPERQPPILPPVLLDTDAARAPDVRAWEMLPAAAPAPSTIMNFDGLDKAGWGAGMPPDTNGDVGPTHYIQSVNSSVGIYRKSDGVRIAAFTLDTFMSQGAFGNPCDSNNMGDPVVLYDTFEDRWVISDFAFTVDGSGNVNNPPGAYECIAVSMTGDPVAGGWNFYSINTAGGLGDYPKLGIWPDGLYMSVNMFDYAAAGAYQGPRVYAFNKSQMYAGDASVQVVAFNGPSADFTLLPSNARLQTGTPPTSTPNYFVSTAMYLNALTVYKFHVDWNNVSLSTFTGPSAPVASGSWPNESVPNAATPANSLDAVGVRAMMQNQYTNIASVESLWTTHTVRRASAGYTAPRWYQVNVTGQTVAATLVQSATWDPDAANVTYRFVPSLAVDRAGNLAIGYSTSNSTTNPGIKYAGRLSTDPANTFSQSEQVLIQGTGTQSGTCGGVTCKRWGDYATMTLDPDGCTFWFTSEYYSVTGLDWLTRIGSFRYSQCTQVGAGGTINGTVTAAGGGAIAGATIRLGARTATTNGSGVYSFTNLPAGSYPSLTAERPGYTTGSYSYVPVTDGGTTLRNFSLPAAPASGCPSDTTQSDFQTGVTNSVDLTSFPGNVTLPAVASINQQQTGVVTGTGYTLNMTTWVGQTFTPSISGPVVEVDLNLWCSSCTGSTPDIPVLIQGTSGGSPTGPDLASATITGFSGGQRWVTAVFNSPFTVTAGTLYAIVVRPGSNPSAGTYAVSRGSGNVYANGVGYQYIGGVWYSQANDLAFKVYINTGYAASGDFTSSTKDANAALGLLPLWSTLTWNGVTLPNTALTFQVAGSNSAAGPFDFIGPDGTASSYFTSSPASLARFHGKRYLQYKAYLSTTSSSVTPVLGDATVCYANQANAAPVLTPIGNKSVGESSTLSFTVSGNDADGDILTYSAVGLPSGASLNAGTGAFTWTPIVGQAGVYNVTFTVSDGLGGTAAEAISITATSASPSSVRATPQSATSVRVTWGPSTGGVTYEVFRRGPGGGYVSLGTTASLAYTDGTASANTAYLYLVRGLSGAGAPGPNSAPDLATTVIFTNDPLAQRSVISATHFTQLLLAINAVRSLAGLSPATFTDSLTTGSVVRKSHVDNLRSFLDEARSALGLVMFGYTDPTITARSTIVRLSHIDDLREGVK